MAVVNVKEFCKRTGFPLAMLRAYCREGKISHWQRGRVYLLDEEDAIGELKTLKETKVFRKRPVTNKVLVERRKVASGAFDYRAEIAKLQKQCKSNARLGDKKE
jgi:hypothetical protein